LLCEAIEAEPDPEVGETILWILSSAWKSGAVDVPGLLDGVMHTDSGPAQRRAENARDWLGLR
ncbi:MAG: hypothetical protein ACRD0R_01080, partial [Acidimicrobiales bacterium]